jgi:hypothetical protein
MQISLAVLGVLVWYWISKHFLFNSYLFLHLLEKSPLIPNAVGLNKILCHCKL